MINQSDLSGKLALDANSLNELRQSSKHNSPEALKAAAKQFEALFMNMMLKSMRDATPHDGMMDSEQGRMYTSMLDQQLSQSLATRGVGLADVLTRQLSSVVGSQSTSLKGGKNAATSFAPAIAPATDVHTAKKPAAHVQAFQSRLQAHAEEASRTTGIPAKFMLGQAALESGWGKKEIIAADGTGSHNLFGIKANKAWKGKVVEAATTEYVNGVAQKKVEKFRAYDSYTDAFRDYANLLKSNPRYESVLANAPDVAGFAKGLQRAGYATDPHYADKLTHLIKQSFSA